MRRFPFVLLCVLTLVLIAGVAGAGASTPRHSARHVKASKSRFVSNKAAKAYAARVTYLVSIDSSYDQVCASMLDIIGQWVVGEREHQGDGTNAFGVIEQEAAAQYASWDSDAGLKHTYGQYLKQFDKMDGSCAKYFRRAADRRKLKRLAGYASADFSKLDDVQLDIGAAFHDLSIGSFDSAQTDANDALTVRFKYSLVVVTDLQALKALEH